MYNFDPYNVLLSIATNIAVLLMTASVLQGHIYNSYTNKDVQLTFGLYSLFIFIQMCYKQCDICKRIFLD